APRGETPHRSSLSRVPALFLTDPGGSVAVYSGLCEDVQPSGGARAPLRHGPEQGQPVEPRAPACAAHGPAHPRRCPGPFPQRPRPATRHLGGGRRHRGHAAGGGASTRRRCPSRHARCPPYAHDGTERRIVRPQDPAEQKESYSGKQKDHTVKNVLLVNALLLIRWLSDTHGGHMHELRIAEATPYPVPAGRRLWQDLGFLAFTLPQMAILMPTKQPRAQELPVEEQRANQALHQRWLRIAPGNSSVTRCRMVKDRS